MRRTRVYIKPSTHTRLSWVKDKIKCKTFGDAVDYLYDLYEKSLAPPPHKHVKVKPMPMNSKPFIGQNLPLEFHSQRKSNPVKVMSEDTITHSKPVYEDGYIPPDYPSDEEVLAEYNKKKMIDLNWKPIDLRSEK